LFEVHPTVDAEVLTEHAGQPRATPLPASMLGRPYHYLQELPQVGGHGLLALDADRRLILGWLQIFRAFDMGFYPDPAVCVWLAVWGRRILAFHEETWFRTPAADLAVRMRETTTEWTGSPNVAMTYVDPKIAEQKGIVTVMDVLELHGVPCEPSINDRILYADAIHGLLGEEIEPGVPRFQIYEPGCPMLAKYLPKMRWDESNPRKMADHKFDHWPIALAYFAISSGVLTVTSQPETVTEPAWMGWIRESQQRTKGRRYGAH